MRGRVVMFYIYDHQKGRIGAPTAHSRRQMPGKGVVGSGMIAGLEIICHPEAVWLTFLPLSYSVQRSIS